MYVKLVCITDRFIIAAAQVKGYRLLKLMPVFSWRLRLQSVAVSL